VDTSEEVRDLVGGEADIALRVCKTPAGEGLVCRRLTDNPRTVYCSSSYAEQRGVPRGVEELARAPLIGGGEPEVWPHYREWLAEHRLEGQVVMQHNSSTGLLAAVRAGMGLAVLPCLVADREPDLVRCLPRSAVRSACGSLSRTLPPRPACPDCAGIYRTAYPTPRTWVRVDHI
jgi:DNA-binding transcriptional LysR family regulator